MEERPPNPTFIGAVFPEQWEAVEAIEAELLDFGEAVLTMKGIAQLGEPMLVRIHKRARALAANAAPLASRFYVSFAVAAARSNFFGRVWADRMADAIDARQAGQARPRPFDDACWDFLEEAGAVDMLRYFLRNIGKL